jgi:hypothetical protein
MQRLGIADDHPDWSDEMYSFDWENIKTVMIGQNGNNESFNQFLVRQLQDQSAPWIICGWHKNQTAMQLGKKGNEMGWEVYETCREHGGIIITGHEHSYSRTKTLINTAEQRVDPACADPQHICVGPGKTMVAVSGLGGHSIRNQDRCLPTTYPYGCHQEWAFVYTRDQNATYGALFIEFYKDGVANQAQGYFKNIQGDVVDEFTLQKETPVQ